MLRREFNIMPSRGQRMDWFFSRHNLLKKWLVSAILNARPFRC
jgi:hypothetical protein